MGKAEIAGFAAPLFVALALIGVGLMLEPAAQVPAPKSKPEPKARALPMLHPLTCQEEDDRGRTLKATMRVNGKNRCYYGNEN